MQKLRIAVIRGGPSEEFEVSLKTGAGILGALNTDRYEPIDVTITKGGEWLLRGAVREPHEILPHIDLAFLALHGGYGEDGQIQRLLDTHGIRYTGSRALQSALAMNKAITKDTLREHDVLMPRHMVVGRSAREGVKNVAESIHALFGPRFVIKPVSGGSSIGTIMAENTLELEQALRKSLEVYEQVLVEERIIGKEATCGVAEGFRGKPLYTFPAIEIVPKDMNLFFDYAAKYDGSTEEICPGRFSRSEKQEIEMLAGKVHTLLELSHYSRSDFMVARDGIYFLEVNTLPGLTPTSLLPKAFDAVGSSYEEFIDHLVETALTHR